MVLAQDTTDIDLTRPEQQVYGAGPLGEGGRRGALLPNGLKLNHEKPRNRGSDDPDCFSYPASMPGLTPLPRPLHP